MKSIFFCVIMDCCNDLPNHFSIFYRICGSHYVVGLINFFKLKNKNKCVANVASKKKYLIMKYDILFEYRDNDILYDILFLKKKY